MLSPLNQRLNHSLNRHTFHRCSPRDPSKHINYARIYLTAIRRYIKIRRQLMKLCPDLFDHGYEVERLAREQKDREFMRGMEDALRKVYGSTEPLVFRTPIELLTPRKRKRVEKLMAELELWLGLAQNARENFTNMPHPPSLSIICSLLEVSITLRCIASGLETYREKPNPCDERDPWEDLERAYGNRPAEPVVKF
ncbi:MAG: hypothetical protein ACK4UN_11225 [Limisphaerales bacterium]